MNGLNFNKIRMEILFFFLPEQRHDSKRGFVVLAWTKELLREIKSLEEFKTIFFLMKPKTNRDSKQELRPCLMWISMLSYHFICLSRLALQSS